MAEVRRVHEANFGVYGVRAAGHGAARGGGLQGVVRGRKVRITIPDPAAACPLDHVNRQFRAPRPNALWVSGFTCVATWSGFVYVAFVIDGFARRILGWRVSRTAHASFVLDTLEQALHQRRPVQDDGLVHRLDKGPQYLALHCTALTGSPRRASNPWSAASATVTTMPWPRRSTACSRPRSSIGAACGAAWRRSSSPPWSG